MSKHMTTKAKALDKLIDAIAGEDVPMTSQTVAGRLDTLADTLAGDDVTFTARDVAGRISQLAGMIEDGTISIGGGGSFKPFNDGQTHFWIKANDNDLVDLYFKATVNHGVTIDWGDGNTTVTDRTSTFDYTHTYETAGDYVITLELTSGRIEAGGSGSNSGIFYYDKLHAWRLRGVELGESFVNYGHLFDSCTALENVKLHESITQINASDYADCHNLKHFVADGEITKIDSSAFKNCYNLVEFDAATKVTPGNWGSAVFSGCHALNVAEVNGTYTVLPQNAFYDCFTLKTFYIPESVDTINAAAFNNCFSLEAVYVFNTTPPSTANSVFYNADKVTIYVPAASVDAYKAASGWSAYASKIQAIPA